MYFCTSDHLGTLRYGAGREGRTPISTLEGWYTAVMPYPHLERNIVEYSGSSASGNFVPVECLVKGLSNLGTPQPSILI